MSNSNLTPSLRSNIVAAVEPSALAVGDHSTSGVDMGKYANIQLIALVGAFGAAATGSIKFEQATAADFLDAKDIESRTDVELAADTPVVMDLYAGELDVNNDFRYVRATLTAGTETVTAGIAIMGFDARHAPADPLDGAIVDSRAA